MDNSEINIDDVYRAISDLYALIAEYDPGILEEALETVAKVEAAREVQERSSRWVYSGELPPDFEHQDHCPDDEEGICPGEWYPDIADCWEESWTR